MQYGCEHRLQLWPAAHDETQPAVTVSDQGSAFSTCYSLKLLQEEFIVSARAIDRLRVARVERDSFPRVE